MNYQQLIPKHISQIKLKTMWEEKPLHGHYAMWVKDPLINAKNTERYILAAHYQSW